MACLLSTSCLQSILVNELVYIHKMIVGITGCHMERINAIMTNKLIYRWRRLPQASLGVVLAFDLGGYLVSRFQEIDF